MKKSGLAVDIAMYAALAVLTAAVFAGVAHNTFVGFDDDYYVTQNAVVRAGLTWPGARWAFTTFEISNWHPLTWLSHMVDVQLFGLSAGAHHGVNVAFHLVSALLLLYFLQSTTGERGKSLFVAALFAVHPLHVESVAWVAERKDVLSHVFFMLVLLAHARYARRPRAAAYVLVMALLALGLMAKPMLVSAPILLLLLDYWPLRRFSLSRVDGPAIRRCVVEKIPLAVLCVASAAVTFAAQRGGGAVRSLEKIPLTSRVLNASLAYCTYVIKTIVPTDLCCLYPFPQQMPLMKAVAAVLLLVGVTLAVLAAARKQRFAVLGWFWYLISLVPVIGLVQVGGQSHADRYTYLPHTGLFICVAWGIPLAVQRLPHKSKLLGAAAAVVIAALSAVTVRQVTVWKDSLSLFTHALEVTERNPLMHYNLGCEYLKGGRHAEAADHFRKAIEYRPDDIDAQTNLGVALLNVRDLDNAVKVLDGVLAKKPEHEHAAFNLALALYQQKQYARAVEVSRQVVRLSPAFVRGRLLLAESLYYVGQNEEAAALFREVLRSDPNNGEARQFLFKLTGQTS